MAGATPIPTMIIGIDPGLTGAIAVMFDNGTLLDVCDTPSFLLDGKRRDYDVPGMLNILPGKMYTPTVFIERQQARPEASAQSMLKVGYGFGLWMGICTARGWPVTVVWPQVWQKEMYQGAVGEGKERSLLIASRLWPSIIIPKTRHDRADAMLIAEYGRRVLGGRVEKWEELS